MAATIHWIVLCALSQLFALFWIYVIWTRSTANMRHLKRYLLEMAVVDMLCSLNMALLVQPSFLYPLPILVINGLYKFLGSDFHVVAISVTLTLVASTFYLTILCSILRFFLIHNYNFIVSLMTQKTGIILHLAVVSATFGLLVFCLRGVILSFKRTFMTAQFYDLEIYLIPYIMEADSVIGVRTSERIIILLLVAIGILVFGTSLTVLLSYLCYKTSSARMVHASAETRSLNRGLTWLMILQCLVPTLTLVIPGFLMILPFYATTSTEFEAFVAEYLCGSAIVAYPIINSLLSLSLIRPYRIFCRKLLSSVFSNKWRSVTLIHSVSNPGSAS